VPGRVGYGAGARDPEDRPNVLRLIEAEIHADDTETLWLIQADLDDLAPEFAASAIDAAIDAGAADAVLMPLTMKKGRPGVRLEALAPAARRDDVERAIFLATSTIGVRRWPLERTVLERHVEEREWKGQRIRWKRVRLPDGTFRAKPEYEDVARAAQALGMTPYQVRAGLSESGDGAPG
jgi:uncharacterized protein (DUF111 family)